MTISQVAQTKAIEKPPRPACRKGPLLPSNVFPDGLILTPVSRWPTRLPESTVQTVLGNPAPVPLADPTWETSGASKRVSVIIATFNGLVFTRLCLESLLANTDYHDFELIVVDNGSSDGTHHYLHTLMRDHPHIRVIFNEKNRGFAGANNQGMAIAQGDIFILLNNDTMVPPGWLTRLVRRLDDPAIGLVGPVTNRIGNEAQVETCYRTYGEFVDFAKKVSANPAAPVFDIRMLAMYCVAMRRSIYEGIGPLDEQFEVGLFEDDDYAMRVRAAGYRVVCTEGVFVHHFGQASLGKLALQDEYGKLFHANRRRWEQKWGTSWQPYKRRPNLSYQQLIERIRETVKTTLPAGSTVLVVSNGDDELLRLDCVEAWHFPQDSDGVYAGYHPVSCDDAISWIESLREKGAEFLLFPSTALWWLDHYAGLSEHLECQYRLVGHWDQICRIVDLKDRKNCQHAAITEEALT